MRCVPSLYDYRLHVNVSYAWRSVLILGRPNSVFSLARSLVRSPSRSPAARTAFVPRRRRDASIAHPPATITTWEGQKLTEYSYHLQIQASSFLLFSKHTSQTYRKCRTKYMWNGLVPLNYSYKKSYQRWREFEKRKRSQVPLLQRKTTPSSTSQFYQELSLHWTPLVVGCSPTYVKSRLCHIVLLDHKS